MPSNMRKVGCSVLKKSAGQVPSYSSQDLAEAGRYGIAAGALSEPCNPSSIAVITGMSENPGVDSDAMCLIFDRAPTLPGCATYS
jgi:hypothetical protein